MTWPTSIPEGGLLDNRRLQHSVGRYMEDNAVESNAHPIYRLTRHVSPAHPRTVIVTGMIVICSRLHPTGLQITRNRMAEF